MDIETKNYIDQTIKDAIKGHRHDGVLTQNVYLNQIIDPASGPAQLKWSSNLAEAFSSFIAITTGATPVNVFGVGGASVPFSIGAVYLISLDTTAGTITVKNATNTVCTIAKGVVAGAMVGATSVANASVHARNAFTIESSSAGNAVVIFQIQYEDS